MSHFSTPTIFELSRPGRRGPRPPSAEADLPPIEDFVPKHLLRHESVGLPEVSELDTVRHYTRLSSKNLAIDNTFYPLGSCTMKYNPRVNEVAANQPGFLWTHPLAEDSEAQGLLEAFHELERILVELSGLPHVSLQPAAGAHGELTSLLMVRAYFREQEAAADETAAGGAAQRRVVLVPDSAHGTNPSSCTLAGFQTREIASGDDGTIDMDDLRAKVGPDVAAMMITNPNTLGLFEPRIEEISHCLHEVGAFLYMDGANMNAIVGATRPGDFGVDVMHFNLHKTFSTPHGGGGPGAGPIATGEALEPYLPEPRLRQDVDGTYSLQRGYARSIGKVRSFFGQSGILLRALAYLLAHGPEEMRGISEHAVLNANYVRKRLEGAFHLPYSTSSLHEVVFTAKKQKRFGVRAHDIAKRLIDLGFHPPTVYFPLVVSEALMIEPTETESKETLDQFIDAMLQIAREAEEQPELVQQAPTTRSVGRLDEVGAVRNPILCCRRPPS